MSNETIILIENIDNTDAIVKYSAPQKGAGYHFKDGLHTFVYEVEEFLGSITLQGTLEQYPGDDDWIDIHDTEFIADGSTEIFSDNFVGKFMWIRAKYQLAVGVIHRVRYNY